MTFNMENRLHAIAIPGSVGILLGYVGLPEAARLLLSAELVSSLFSVLCCSCLMFDCVRKVVDSLVCHSVKVSIFQEFSLDLAASISLAISKLVITRLDIDASMIPEFPHGMNKVFIYLSLSIHCPQGLKGIRSVCVCVCVS